jgi:hypothetical protein
MKLYVGRKLYFLATIFLLICTYRVLVFLMNDTTVSPLPLPLDSWILVDYYKSDIVISSNGLREYTQFRPPDIIAYSYD